MTIADAVAELEKVLHRRDETDTMTVVGLGHTAQVGKDTAAQILIDELGFTRISIADQIRRFMEDQPDHRIHRSNWTSNWHGRSCGGGYSRSGRP
jgi:2-phosphoglycerate kinase